MKPKIQNLLTSNFTEQLKNFSDEDLKKFMKVKMSTAGTLQKAPFANPTMRNDELELASTFANLLQSTHETFYDLTEAPDFEMPTYFELIERLRDIHLVCSRVFNTTI